MLASKTGLKVLGGAKPLQVRTPIKRKGKGKKKVVQPLELVHEKWFFNLSPKYFKQMSEEWNEHNLKITIKPQANYDDWLNYFKTLPPTAIKLLAITGQDFLSTEAYAALSRWHDIIGNPHRIEKIHQSGLTNPSKGKEEGIVAKALKNDRYGVLCATRDRIAEKLEKGAGARDTAALAKELTEVMTQIADYEKRLGPKKTTKLGKLLDDMHVEIKPKRSRIKGARNTSFKSRVTIKDVEG